MDILKRSREEAELISNLSSDAAIDREEYIHTLHISQPHHLRN